MNNQFTVLIIEDEKNISNFMNKILTAHGYHVISSYCGRDGLSVISSRCPDVILLDLGLPDMDGMDIIRQVRSWSNSPIIVILCAYSGAGKSRCPGQWCGRLYYQAVRHLRTACPYPHLLAPQQQAQSRRRFIPPALSGAGSFDRF